MNKPSDNVTCPTCGASFPLTEAVAGALRDNIREEMAGKVREMQERVATQQADLATREESLKERESDFNSTVAEAVNKEKVKLVSAAKKEAGAEVEAKMEALSEELERKSVQLKEFSTREAALKRQERELAEKAANLTIEFEDKLAEQVRAASEVARRKAEEQWKDRVEEGRQALERSESEKKALATREADLLKKERDLADQKEQFDVEIQRRLNEERDSMQQQMRMRVHSEYELKLADKDKMIKDIGEQVKELQQKQEQASQQLQGEVQELALEDMLRRMFPTDEVAPVPKGVEGADCLHKVITREGRVAGVIVWESKRTKRWNADWVGKLKEDQMRVGGSLCAILTSVLPPDVRNFGEYDGVWVANWESVQGMAVVLRRVLIEAALARQSEDGKTTKMQMMYEYLTGPVFAQRVQTIISAYQEMKSDLDKEKLALQRLWKKREKQIEGLLVGTSSMHGEISGIVGKEIASVVGLELGGPADSDD